MNVAMREKRVLSFWPNIIPCDLRRGEIEHCDTKFYQCGYERREITQFLA